MPGPSHCMACDAETSRNNTVGAPLHRVALSMTPLELFGSLCLPDAWCISFLLLGLTWLVSRMLLCHTARPSYDLVYVAYSIVNVLVNDPYCIYIGVMGYLSDTPHNKAPADLAMLVPSLLVRMCQCQFARQTASLVCEFTYSTKNWCMMVHHLCVMGATAACPYVYLHGMTSAKAVYFFGGVSEISTVFLTSKDLCSAVLRVEDPRIGGAVPCAVDVVHRVSRVLFVLTFVVFRFGWWSVHAYEVAVRMSVMSVWDATVGFVALCMGTLTLMQYYWMWLICFTVCKELQKPPPPKVGKERAADDHDRTTCHAESPLKHKTD